MSQKYVPDGTMLVCTTGTKMSRLKVTNQSMSRMSDGRLIGTFKDKMEDNLYCVLLNTAGAAVGAICAGALAVALGVTALLAAAAVVGGAFAGSLINRIPCICAMISSPVWMLPHPTVRIGGLLALPEKAFLPCTLGGPVKIMMLDLVKALTYAKLCDDSYKDVSDGMIDGWEEDTEFSKKFKMKVEQSGFFARLYKSGDNYVLVFRGTDADIKKPGELWKDAKTDVKQAIGMKDEQYEKAAQLTKEIKDELKENPETQDANLEVAGHSLGGGLAATASADSDVEAYTFNAAGVHDSTYKKDENGNPIKNKENVYAFHAQDGDMLNTLQDNRSVLSWVPGLGFLLAVRKGLPPAAGERIGMETDASFLDLITFKGHGLEKLKKAIEEESKKQKPITVKAETI